MSDETTDETTSPGPDQQPVERSLNGYAVHDETTGVSVVFDTYEEAMAAAKTGPESHDIRVLELWSSSPWAPRSVSS